MAEKLVPKCLDAMSTDTIGRYFNLTWRYLDPYQYVLHLVYPFQVPYLTNNSQGLSIEQAEYG